MRRLALVGLLTAACAPRVVPATPVEEPPAAAPYERAPSPDVGPIRQAAAQLWHDETLASANGWRAGKTPDRVSLPEALRTTDAVAAIRAARAASPSGTDDSIALLHLESFLASETIGRAAVEAQTAFLSQLVQTKVRLRGSDDVPLMQLEERLAQEPSAVQRAQISAAESPALAPLEALVQRRHEVIRTAAIALGYTDLDALRALVGEASVDSSLLLAEAVLAATQPFFEASKREIADHTLGITDGRLRLADLPRLARAGVPDADFSPGTTLPKVRALLGALGLAVDEARLHFDAEPAPERLPGALFLAPSSSEVMLLVRDVGGVDSARSLLRAAARAEAVLHCNTTSLDLCVLGGGAIRAAQSALFDDLADDPLWLREATALRGARLDEAVHGAALRRLLLVRHAAARVLFAHASPDAYTTIFSRALGVPIEGSEATRWPLEADDWMESADRLRGFLLAAQIRETLIGAASGEHWWTPTGAAPLVAFWSQGTRPSPMAIDASAFVRLATSRLAYRAPDPPPPTPPRPVVKHTKHRKRRRK